MLIKLLFVASMVFFQPLELEVGDYIRDAHRLGEYDNGSAKIIKMNNGVTFRLQKEDSTLLAFDLLGNGLSYGNVTVGKEIKKTNEFLFIFNHTDGTVCYIKKYEDNSILRISTKDGIVRKITRLSRKITEA